MRKNKRVFIKRINNPIEKAILQTLCWFALFEYPLTSFEIWKYLFGKTSSLEEVLFCLDQSTYLHERLYQKDGFFFLKFYENVSSKWLKNHHENFLDSVRKLKKVRTALWFFRLFPSVECVMACNSLAWFSTKPDSDIDLFILVKPKTIWLTRLLLVLPFALLKKRPESRKKDPFCFSFFLTTDHLDIEPFAFKESDPYLAYWIFSLIPLFDRRQIFEEFIQKNIWAKVYFPNAQAKAMHKELSISSNSFSFPLFCFWWMEPLAKYIQQKYLPTSLKILANQDTRVVINDTVLKFHADDKRQIFYEKWRKQCDLIITYT
jgi:hypothetical protein